MQDINCRSCNALVSPSFKICPICGIYKPSLMQAVLVIALNSLSHMVVLFVILLLLFAGVFWLAPIVFVGYVFLISNINYEIKARKENIKEHHINQQQIIKLEIEPYTAEQTSAINE